MVDKIEKALRKLSAKERRVIAVMMKQIKSGNVADFDVKKLKGNKSIYRVRKGGLRIIYAIDSKENIRLLAIERRSDTTYKKF